MGFFLLDNPPRSPQFYATRNGTPTWAVAAMLVVVGVLTLADAANDAHLTPEDLIAEALTAEAEAWGM